jgi:hypothetical protein
MRPHLASFCLALSLFTTGCFFHKAPRPVAYTPPPPRPRLKPGPAPVLPDAPDLLLAVQLPAPLPAVFPSLPEFPRPIRTRPPLVAGPKPPPTLPDQPAPPKLGEIYTPEKVREYNRQIDESLERVKRASAALAHRQLNAEDGVTMERIRTFQRQAEQARQEDLVTAVNLAKRADLLAQDLLSRLQN